MNQAVSTGEDSEIVPEVGDLAEAAARLRPFLPATAMVRSTSLSRCTGADVWLKLETLQPTHSFKVRGALNAMLAMPPELRARGVVAASQGNHGLGVAWAASQLGVSATVYLPADAQTSRIKALEHMGATVALHGSSWDDANTRATRDAAESGRPYIHPFNDPEVMAGAGTMLPEVMEQGGPVDVVVASVGGGGLLSGLIAAVLRYTPATRVVGVETEGADCMAQSLRAGAIVTLPAITSVARSLGALKTEPTQLHVVSRHAHDAVVVSDADTKRLVLSTWRSERVLLEPAAAYVLAALETGRVDLKPGERVVAIACGANVELEEVSSWLTPDHP